MDRCFNTRTANFLKKSEIMGLGKWGGFQGHNHVCGWGWGMGVFYCTCLTITVFG